MEKKNQVPKYPPLRFPEFTDEWKECKISDYGTVVTGSTPSTKDVENYEDDGFLWASPADIDGNKFIERTKTTLSSKGFDKTRKLPPLSVLAVCIGSSIGKLAMAKNEMATNQQINSIVSNPLHSPEFVYYAITSRFRSYLSAVAVQAVPIISKSTFERLPNSTTSLPEQRKIAALLSLIDERIEVQNAIIKEREAQKASLLRRLFDRTLRFPEFTDEWKEVKLGEVAEIIGGGTPSTTTTNYWDGEIVWFNPSEIGKKKYVSNSNRTISFQGLSNSGARLLPKGTVLLTTRATIGEIAIANVECTTNQGFQSVVTGHEANNEYVYYFLSTQKVYLLRHSSGSTFLETPSSVIRNLPLRLPSLAEQRKIAALLLAVDERITVEKEYATLLQKQKAYLLRQMFI